MKSLIFMLLIAVGTQANAVEKVKMSPESARQRILSMQASGHMERLKKVVSPEIVDAMEYYASSEAITEVDKVATAKETLFAFTKGLVRALVETLATTPQGNAVASYQYDPEAFNLPENFITLNDDCDAFVVNMPTHWDPSALKRAKVASVIKPGGTGVPEAAAEEAGYQLTKWVTTYFRGGAADAYASTSPEYFDLASNGAR